MQSPLSSDKGAFAANIPLRKKTRAPIFAWAGLIVVAVLLSYKALDPLASSFSSASGTTSSDVCPQVPALLPTRNRPIWDAAREHTASDDFKARAVGWLAGAVRIPTESYDDMQAVGVDPRWDVFRDFHAYLAQAFPLVHARLTVRKINTYALWYEWTGTDTALKPVLLMAHQDVVPVNPATAADWTHPPFSGYFDGHRIWGRGSSDNKNGVIGILSAIETLLSIDFVPTRTVVVAFGFDEEVTGSEGAGHLSAALLEAYEENAFAFIIDEGGQMFGAIVALPGVTEKGYMDVVVEVTSPGGHSSVPPDHTTIGMLAALLVQYENNPYPVHLSRQSVPYQTFQCFAQHSAMPPAVKALIDSSRTSDAALRALGALLAQDKLYGSVIRTTQAIDVISGGIKSNALPEQAHAIVNHRIHTESSVAEVRAHDTALLAPLAAHFNLTYHAFGVDVMASASAPGASGALTLGDMGNVLEPAPVTPTRGLDAAAYDMLAGTIVATYSTRRLAGPGGDNETVFVAPSIMFANTDTRFYWKLSPNIFRYGHSHGNSVSASADLGPDLEDMFDGIHTVNESIDADDFMELIRFFVTLVLNADESTTL
ncbi:hypothetical protein GGX14DRAFT_434106 [Mycena pura]|uniref:Peptidase M20 dimerisation domain-containing protein n=1 Tax=Mycena pura TaxID=153505 RepID=A0AAD6YIS9_9AGAR|nr:hypothetical protein GGX14DRAFT_434106 [Mycena pura]